MTRPNLFSDNFVVDFNVQEEIDNSQWLIATTEKEEEKSWHEKMVQNELDNFVSLQLTEEVR